MIDTYGGEISLRLTKMLFRTLLLLAMIGFGVTGAVRAQDAASAPAASLAGPIEQASTDLDKAKSDLVSLQESAKQNADNDDALVGLTTKVDELGRRMIAVSTGLRGRVDQINARLTELGDPPKDGQPPEAAIVTDERNKLTAERAQINALTGDLDTLSAAATKLGGETTEMRRRLFTDTLLRRTEISTSVLDDAGQALVTEASNFQQAMASWLGFVWKFKRIPLFAALLLSLGAALILLRGGYRLFGPYLARSETGEEPSYISRLSIAFWSTVIRTMALTALLITSYFFLNSFNVLRPDVAPILGALFGMIGLVYFVGRVTNAVFAPSEPHWRLVKLSNIGARTLSICLLAMAIVNGFDYVLSRVSEAMGSPVVVTVVKSLVASLIIGGIIIAASFGKPMLAKSGDPDAPGRRWPRGMAIILRVIGFGLIFVALAGYVGLARFMATQLIITGAVVVTMYIGILSGKAISRQESFSETSAARFLRERFNFGPVAIDQAGLLAGLGIYGVALLTGVPLVLLLWGFHIQDLEILAYRLFTEVRLGNISISLVGILTGILLFAGGFLLTRWIQRWLDGNVMARSHVDLGVRNSVKTGIGYLGVGIAAIVGVSAAGIDLSSFALVASALSIGIGFGLQNIVSNFVSGLILLVERPFKVGDHIVSGTAEGIVKRISVRATEIETFRKQSIIVPNSDLINASLGNWTHRNKIGRSEIPISVSYDADPQKVMDILLELVNDIPLVMRNPEPHVEFLRFGTYTLDFELRFHLADMGDGMAVRNNLRIAILKRFKEEGITIPLPQSDVLFHQLPAPPAGKGPLVEEHPQEEIAEAEGDDERPVELRDRKIGGTRKS